MEKNENTNKKLENLMLLKSFSEEANFYCEMNGLNFEKVNEKLAVYYKSLDLGTEFRKFRAWVNEGKKIRKGAKGKLFWTRPLKELNLERESCRRELTEEEKNELLQVSAKYSFCYLFSEKDLQ